jgi:uncharacterized protein involved in exopolysaccharide biosynthesis
MSAQAGTVDIDLAPDDGARLLERIAVLRRRLPLVLGTFATLASLTLLAAFLWPPTFQSTGIVLIEQQEVPEEFVRSAVTSYADQRVKMISQRVMTTANLLEIIRKYDLYSDRQRREPREKLLERMRDDIGLEMISADVVDPVQGRATKATIAFAVSYRSGDAERAAKVANELTTLYLNENVETRKQLAADTAQFLRQEAERVGKDVASLDQRIAAFKTQHADSLPERAQVNLQLMTRAEDDLREVETRLTSLEQQAVYLDAQLAQVRPNVATIGDNGQLVLSPEDRLRLLQTQLASARSLYQPDHPDVLRLEREVKGLQRQVGAQSANEEMVRQLAQAKSQLAQARTRYSPDHPDVRRLERLVASVEQAMQQSEQTAATLRDAERPDNPAYIQLQAQREAVNAERAALARERAQLRERVDGLERHLSSAPSIEREYSALLRDLQGAQVKYQEVRQKQMAAQLAQNLEAEQKGERFTLIEPPLVPEQPASPNRVLILVLGLLLSFAGAIGGALLVESVDGRVGGMTDVAALVGVAPLASVPWIELEEDRTRGRSRRHLALATLGLAAATGLTLVHFFYRPLDVLWLVVLRRVGL